LQSVVVKESVLNLLPEEARNTPLSVACLSVVLSEEIRGLPLCVAVAEKRKATTNLLPEKGFRPLYDVQAVSRSSPVAAIKEEAKKIVVLKLSSVALSGKMHENT